MLVTVSAKICNLYIFKAFYAILRSTDLRILRRLIEIDDLIDDCLKYSKDFIFN